MITKRTILQAIYNDKLKKQLTRIRLRKEKNSTLKATYNDKLKKSMPKSNLQRLDEENQH